jgi:hypothetical protein
MLVFSIIYGDLFSLFTFKDEITMNVVLEGLIAIIRASYYNTGSKQLLDNFEAAFEFLGDFQALCIMFSLQHTCQFQIYM